MGFVAGGGNIAIATALPPSFCVLYCNHQTVYGISISYFLCLTEATVSGCREYSWPAASCSRCLQTTRSVVMYWAKPGTLVTWPWRRLGMTYCCATLLLSQICVTCQSWWFPDLVPLSCCAGAGCLGPEGWGIRTRWIWSISATQVWVWLMRNAGF